LRIRKKLQARSEISWAPNIYLNLHSKRADMKLTNSSVAGAEPSYVSYQIAQSIAVVLHREENINK
jgi:hypothetical protein